MIGQKSWDIIQLDAGRPIYGESLTFDTSADEASTINGHPVNYAPKKVFESPFRNADWNSSVVTISKGDWKKMLNLERENSAQDELPR